MMAVVDGRPETQNSKSESFLVLRVRPKLESETPSYMLESSSK